VLGHAQCGGIKAVVEESKPLSPGDFIGRWMALIAPTVEEERRGSAETPAEFITRMEQHAVKISLKNLMTFPCVQILVDRGKLNLHGAYFGVAHGSLSVLDPASGKFERVAAAA
jgi:carbonic anhydrase